MKEFTQETPYLKITAIKRQNSAKVFVRVESKSSSNRDTVSLEETDVHLIDELIKKVRAL